MGLDFEALDFVASIVAAPFPIVAARWRVGIDAFGSVRPEKLEELAGPLNRVLNEIFVAYPEIGASVVWETSEQIRVDGGPIAIGEPVVDELRDDGFDFAEGHFAERGGRGMDIAGKNDLFDFAGVGQFWITLGFVEPCGAFQNDDSFVAKSGDFRCGVRRLELLEVRFGQTGNIRCGGHQRFQKRRARAHGAQFESDGFL